MAEKKSFDYWSYFAGEARRTSAFLYERFAQGVRSDAQLQAFAAGAREGQPQANILFGAVHYLLLRGAEHPLRGHYPNLNGGVRTEGEDPFPYFLDFVSRYRDQLTSLIATRVTNTNEVGRSALLHAGFRDRQAIRRAVEPDRDRSQRRPQPHLGRICRPLLAR